METSDAVLVEGRRLGKLPPKYDARTLRLARYIEKRKLPKIPTRHVLSKKTVAAFPSLGMMGNDTLGDCTFASKGHLLETWTAWGGKPWRPTDKQIEDAYFATGDHQDTGRDMLEVLNYLRTTGLGGNKIYAFVAIDPKDHDMVRTAHFLFGGLDVGLSLPVTAQAQENKIWDYVPNTNGNEPNSWGGHDVNLEDTGARELTIITWGHLQRMTWTFWDAYCDEVFAVLDESWVGDDCRSPQGFSLKKLADDLKGL